MSMAFAKLMLSQSGSVTTTQVATKATANPPASVDFTYTFAASGLVSVDGKAGGGFAGATQRTKQWNKP
jgi:hypothetical protein